MKLPRFTGTTVLAIAIAAAGLAEFSLRGASETTEPVIKVTAKRFEFSPDVIHLKRNVPVVLEFTSGDRKHGFKAEGLGLRATIRPGQTERIRLVPAKAGTYPFHCDVFCGDGHEGMSGTIVVE
jgi:cytochrome c oxidase subunit 2